MEKLRSAANCGAAKAASKEAQTSHLDKGRVSRLMVARLTRDCDKSVNMAREKLGIA
jgi:hypothetical protein